MSMRLNRPAFENMVMEDTEWLSRQPRTLEREHILCILKEITHLEYDVKKELASARAEVERLEKALRAGATECRLRAQHDDVTRGQAKNWDGVADRLFAALSSPPAKPPVLSHTEDLRSCQDQADKFPVPGSAPSAEAAKPGLIPARCHACGEVIPTVCIDSHACPQGEAARHRAFDVGYDAQGNVAGTKPAEADHRDQFWRAAEENARKNRPKPTEAFNPATSPGMTDLMVTPESLEKPSEPRWTCRCGFSNNPVQIRCMRCGADPEKGGGA